MNKLQEFISSKPGGFLTEKDMPELIALDRLCQVLVRCGSCRFTCGAQYVAHLIKCVEAGGDYVRDVSFPVGSFEAAAGWKAEPIGRRIISGAFGPGVCTDATAHDLKVKFDNGVETKIERAGNVHYENRFNENDCGGVFDGHQVISDADPGL